MDINQEDSKKTIYIELELVLDVYSLVFCSTRFHLERKYHLHIDNQEVALFYGKTIKQGVNDLLSTHSDKLDNSSQEGVDSEVNEIINIFLNYKESLKPTVPSIHVLNELKKNENVDILLFSYIENIILSKIFTDELTQLMKEVVPFDDLVVNPNLNENTTLIFGCINHLDSIMNLSQKSNISVIHVKQPKQEECKLAINTFGNLAFVPFENYGLKKLDPCYEGELKKVELNKQINTAELPFWKASIPVDKIQLRGIVVNGFKRGSKELGVPTANLELWEEHKNKIDGLLPGVYWGTVQFITWANKDELINKFGEKYWENSLRTALSIGWNPSFDNDLRTIEAYILEEFENDFYGEELNIEVTHYIRAESNYSSLDHLIMAIHNDIESTKHTVIL